MQFVFDWFSEVKVSPIVSRCVKSDHSVCATGGHLVASILQVKEYQARRPFINPSK